MKIITFHIQIGNTVQTSIYYDTTLTNAAPITSATPNLEDAKLQAQPQVGASLLQYGQVLFDSLFVDKLRDELIQALELSETQIRILLDFDYEQHADLSMLPWELMSVTVGYGNIIHLATSDNCTLMRFVRPTLSFALGMPKIQLLTASPHEKDGKGFKPLNTTALWLELSQMADRQEIELAPLVERTDLERFIEAVQREPSILHLAAHGTANPPQIILVNSAGFTQATDATILAEKIKKAPQILVLQTCDSATADGNHHHIIAPFFSRGIPYMIAMQYSIKVHLANHFAIHFYRKLTETQSIEQAMQSARASLTDIEAYDTLAFATPVLFTHVLLAVNNVIVLDDLPISLKDIAAAFPFIFDVTPPAQIISNSDTDYEFKTTVETYEGDNLSIRRNLMDAIMKLDWADIEDICFRLDYPCHMWSKDGRTRVRTILETALAKGEMAYLDAELRQRRSQHYLPRRISKTVHINITQAVVENNGDGLQGMRDGWQIFIRDDA